MKQRSGVWLTPEQSVRLTILDSVSREKAIEYIVYKLRENQRGAGGRFKKRKSWKEYV